MIFSRARALSTGSDSAAWCNRLSVSGSAAPFAFCSATCAQTPRFSTSHSRHIVRSLADECQPEKAEGSQGVLSGVQERAGDGEPAPALVSASGGVFVLVVFRGEPSFRSR